VDVRRHRHLLGLDDDVRADVIKAAVRCVPNSFLGKLPAVAQFGDGKVQFFVAQNLHLDSVLRRHRCFAALLDATV
tara:strand:- start:5587 stop:5814 length:228 start_codon:yes stop_codon:yes gene_type:complete